MRRPLKTSTTRLPKKLQEELNLNSGGSRGGSKKKPNVSNRKERRKQERQVKKHRRQHNASHRLSGELPRTESSAGTEVVAAAPSKPTRDVSPKPILKKTKPVKTKHDENEEGDASLPTIRKAIKDQLEQDDAEIAYLEKKLKIKDKKRIPKSFQEDGLDFLLEGLDKDFLGDDKFSRGTKRKRAPEPEPEEDSDDEGDKDMDGEEDGFDEEDDGPDDILDGMDLDEGSEGEWDDGLDDTLDGVELDEDGKDQEDEDAEDDDGGGEDEDISEDLGPEEEGEFKGFSSDSEPEPAKEPNDKKAYPEATTKEANTSKYIPPSLHKAPATESDQLTRLRRQTQGLLNRLSEANLLSILSDIEKLYSSNPRGHMTSLLTDILISTICDRSSLLDNFMILHAGFVAGIYKLSGTDFGARVVQRIVEEFDVYYQKSNGIDDPATAGKECTNLMSFVSELYNFQVVGCVIIFDFVRIFSSEITELNTELLLKIVRNSGHQLRQDDPAALKDLIVMMQPSISKVGQANLSTRTKFMIETLTNLKNNRLKFTTASSAVTTEATVRMKKLLGSLNTRKLRASEPLRASLSDIRNAETKGKWWLVGASWIGNQASDPQSTQQPSSTSTSTSTKSEKDSTDDGDFGAGADLLQLAREQRMNTDVRRAIFVTIMSAEDYTDAHSRLLKLRLKKAQEREIPRVLIHCCGAEPTHNPYYTLIARKLCGQHSLKMTFTFSLWELFRRMGEDDGGGREVFDGGDDGDDEEGITMRKMVNLAKMYGTLIAEGALTLSVLKTINLAYLQTKTKTFLELMFITVFLHSQRNVQDAEGKQRRDEKAVMDIFLKVNDNVPLVRGVLFFLKKYVRNTNVAGGKDETTTVRWGAGVASGVLNAIVAREITGD